MERVPSLISSSWGFSASPGCEEAGNAAGLWHSLVLPCSQPCQPQLQLAQQVREPQVCQPRALQGTALGQLLAPCRGTWAARRDFGGFCSLVEGVGESQSGVGWKGPQSSSWAGTAPVPQGAPSLSRLAWDTSFCPCWGHLGGPQLCQALERGRATSSLSPGFYWVHSSFCISPPAFPLHSSTELPAHALLMGLSSRCSSPGSHDSGWQ